MKESNIWKMMFENHQNPCYVLDKDNAEFLYVNPRFSEVFHLGEEILGKKIVEVITPQLVQMDKPIPNWDTVDTFETNYYHKKLNQNFFLRCLILKEQGAVFSELQPSDITESSSHRFERAMSRCMEIYTQSSEEISYSLMEYFGEFFDCEASYIYRYDEETEVLYCVAQWSVNPMYQQRQEVATDYSGKDLMKLLTEENEAGIYISDRTVENFQQGSIIARIMDSLHLKNITLCSVEDSDHEIVGFVGLSNRKSMHIPLERRLLTAVSRFVAQDVTKGMVNQTLFELHHRDILTGLYNRNGYAKRIDQIMSAKPKSLGVIVANINGLKYINENAGITGGDEHIKKAALCIKEVFGFEVFRMSGDEFMGLLADIEEKDFEDKVMALHSKMKDEGNYDFSFGHAWAGKKFELGKLQYEAETVMYINKQEYYSASKREFDAVKDTTLSDLLSYLQNEEFMIYLQPQVLLSDGSLSGAEALIRRFDKTNQKMVFPDQFIPLYEQKSVIRHVDMFVVEEVCRLISQWEKADCAIPISVNLSRVTLLEYGIVKAIVDICDKYGIDRKYLVIEVTERVGLIENNVASSLIMDFINNGFRISLDDFGCAYSNIVTLAQIDVDEVKLDKSLVDNLTTSKKNRVLVRNVLNMCHELDGTSTLAEGIEDKEQADLLRNLGCHLGQGYYYSRPIPVGEFSEKYMMERKE